MPKREYVEITDMLSGLVFRFYFDREDPRQLHIQRRWGVEPETAVRVYFDQSAEIVCQPQRRRFETRSADYILAWLRMDASRVLVITCLPRERTNQPQGEPDD